MFHVGQEVRVKSTPGMCCGVGLCGVQAEIVRLYFTSPYSQSGMDRAYELSTGDIIKQDNLEAV